MFCFKRRPLLGQRRHCLETTRDLYTSMTRYCTARWPGRPSLFLRMRALDLTRLKVTLPVTPSSCLMSKGQMTTYKENLALHDALSDAYDEDQETDEQHAEKQHENPIGR